MAICNVVPELNDGFQLAEKLDRFVPTFDEIENYTGFGYCWKKPA